MNKGRVAAVGVGAVALLALLWMGLRSVSDEQPPAQPHVVFIVMCSVRADQTALYGGPDTMPALQRLGDAGVVFDDGVTAAPWTRPSTAALLTGRHPMSLGMLHPGIGRNERVLSSDALTLAEHLSEHGYWTVGRTGNPNSGPEYGFEQGFDDYQRLQREGGGPDKVDGADIVTDLLAAVDQHQDEQRPGFVFGLFVDAHAPVTVGPADRVVWEAPGVSRRLAGYRAMLSSLDSHLGSLVDGLAEKGWTTENTLFVVVNDHGEGLDEPAHHGRSHGWNLYPSVTRMVWAMAGPGVSTGRVHGLASGLDVAPTLLALADLPVPSKMEGLNLQHVAVDPSLRTGREEAWSTTMFGATERAVMVREDVACLGEFAAYDPDHRPREPWRTGCVDRQDDPTWAFPQPDRERMAYVRSRWQDWARMNEAAASTASTPDSEMDAALRALGYVE